MYASKRSVAKAQEWDAETRKNTRNNKLRHRGMQKDHIQITPDGKVIQHYKFSNQAIAWKKAFNEAYSKKQAEQEQNEMVEAVTK